MSKINSKKIIIIICILVILGVGHFVTSLFLQIKVDSFRSDVLFEFAKRADNIQFIPYEYLDEKYRSIVTKTQYNEATTGKEVVDILKLFNEIPHTVEPITFITTDGYKTCPRGRVQVNGLIYEIYHHIDFDVKNFKPCVIKWYVDIAEVEYSN